MQLFGDLKAEIFDMKPGQASRMARDMAVEQSLDAAIEIDEVVRGLRGASPALESLILNLIGSGGHDLGAVKRELLNNSRLTSLYFNAAKFAQPVDSTDELDELLSLLLRSIAETNLSAFPKQGLLRIRDFCIGLNKELVSEAFGRNPMPPFATVQKNSLSLANAG